MDQKTMDEMMHEVQKKNLRHAVAAMAFECRELEERIEKLENQLLDVGYGYEKQIEELKRQLARAEGRDLEVSS